MSEYHYRLQRRIQPQPALIPTLRDIRELAENTPHLKGFYYFYEEYHEDWDNHIQVDLLTSEPLEVSDLPDRVEREDYWQWDGTVESDHWWEGPGPLHDVIKHGNIVMAENALMYHLDVPEADKAEKWPRHVVRRRWHLTANQYGLGYWDEFKLCVVKGVRLLFLIVFGKRVFKLLFHST